MNDVVDDGPTPEQLARGQHERVVAYLDKPGGGKEARTVWRKVDTVTLLFERGKLGATARANEDAFMAAMRFRRDYGLAQLDPQRAAPMDRVAGGCAPEADQVWPARARVAAALNKLGRGTLGALVVELVVGKCLSIVEASELQEHSRDVLTGALVGALGTLANDSHRAGYRVSKAKKP